MMVEQYILFACSRIQYIEDLASPTENLHPAMMLLVTGKATLQLPAALSTLGAKCTCMAMASIRMSSAWASAKSISFFTATESKNFSRSQ